MAIYTIGDLHLSFSTDKPMDIFGYNWENHAEKIKNDWLSKVKETDTVILPGDFSWATYITEAYEDFKFLSELPGKKIMSKGNHDYWWTTVTSMKRYLMENEFNNIDFLFNNSYLIEDKVIVGTRGWQNSYRVAEDYKILKRENDRLKLSIQDGIKNYGVDKEFIAFIHYPPFYKEESIPEEIDFIKTLKEYGINRCFYAHLHGESHKDAIEGIVDGIEYKLVSSDFLEFKLLQIQ
ncbi:MAG: metallophosphoesterase [Clostridia bacterium]|nr:metallophosphoesterase [Clostridia bacterium]